MSTSLPQERLIAIISFYFIICDKNVFSITNLNVNINNITSHLHSLEIINNYLKLKIKFLKKIYRIKKLELIV